jgi:small multidrug resistance family-3 protein
MFDFFRVTGLFFVTAVAEIVGCYLPWLVLTQGRPAWWLLPAAASLAVYGFMVSVALAHHPLGWWARRP